MGKQKSMRQSVFVQSAVKQHGLELAIKTFEEDPAGAYVNFVIEVKKDGHTWETRKRYSEFHFFHQAVQQSCGNMKKSFPAKTMGKLSHEALEKRLISLNDWFQDFLDNVAMGPELLSQLEAFLGPKDASNEENDAPQTNTSKRIDNLSRIAPGKVLKAGYLNKLGGNKSGSQGNWKRRYFVLQDDMKYFEDEATFSNGGLGKGIVKLNVFFVSVADGENPQFQFTVHAMPHPLVCRCESKEDLDSWVGTLNSLADLGH